MYTYNFTRDPRTEKGHPSQAELCFLTKLNLKTGRMVICLTFLFSLWGIFLRILAGCSPGEPVFLVKLTDGILSVE